MMTFYLKLNHIVQHNVPTGGETLRNVEHFRLSKHFYFWACSCLQVRYYRKLPNSLTEIIGLNSWVRQGLLERTLLLEDVILTLGGSEIHHCNECVSDFQPTCSEVGPHCQQGGRSPQICRFKDMLGPAWFRVSPQLNGREGEGTKPLVSHVFTTYYHLQYIYMVVKVGQRPCI